MTIDLSVLPKHVTLTVGERIELPLPSYAGSGNAWSATCIRGLGVADIAVAMGHSASADAAPTLPVDGTAEPPALMLVPERAVVRGLACGEAIWHLVLARSFDPARATATHVLQIAVVAAV